jgi:hypothetical protein
MRRRRRRPTSPRRGVRHGAAWRRRSAHPLRARMRSHSPAFVFAVSRVFVCVRPWHSISVSRFAPSSVRAHIARIVSLTHQVGRARAMPSCLPAARQGCRCARGAMRCSVRYTSVSVHTRDPTERAMARQTWPTPALPRMLWRTTRHVVCPRANANARTSAPAHALLLTRAPASTHADPIPRCFVLGACEFDPCMHVPVPHSR